jgi:hypothetical protein
MSVFTAKGDLAQLQKSLNDGLIAGLTINEVKEVLVHQYAYCRPLRFFHHVKLLLLCIFG